MAITKDQVTSALTDLGIQHDPSAKVADLKALLPEDHPLVAPVDAAPPAPQVDAERQARWDAFLANARLVNPERFDAQKANHEFDTIPDSFK